MQKEPKDLRWDPIMVQGEACSSRKPRRPDLRTCWKTKSDYITQKVGIYGTIWEQNQNE